MSGACAQLLSGLCAILPLMFIAWLISVWRRNVAIVDVFWGLAVAGAGFGWLMASGTRSTRAQLVMVLATLWALRLAVHILWRGWGQPEDRRYRNIRARNEPSFALKSLYLVFALQAILAWVVALPLYGAVRSTVPLGILDLLGVALWVVGFAFEAVADWQLAAFQRRNGSSDSVLDLGLWRYSRHPNYFGEFCSWWGMWLLALSGGAWWSIAGPALLTFLLLRVSGVALTEKDIAERRPAYLDYRRRTSAFVPRPPLIL
ncbi:MAG: DUF1295 domain-containing protein [Gammaproteobacteria bacterium]